VSVALAIQWKTARPATDHRTAGGDGRTVTHVQHEFAAVTAVETALEDLSRHPSGRTLSTIGRTTPASIRRPISSTRDGTAR
jgi:hypothetical protein